MNIINMSIPHDFSQYALEKGLRKLNPKDPAKVRLLLAASYSFHDIYKTLYSDQFIKRTKLKFKNIDTSEVLKHDS